MVYFLKTAGNYCSINALDFHLRICILFLDMPWIKTNSSYNTITELLDLFSSYAFYKFLVFPTISSTPYYSFLLQNLWNVGSYVFICCLTIFLEDFYQEFFMILVFICFPNGKVQYVTESFYKFRHFLSLYLDYFIRLFIFYCNSFLEAEKYH